MKVKMICVFLIFAASLLTGCDNSAKTNKDVADLGSAGFQDFAVETSENGKALVYTEKNSDCFSGGTSALPVEANYFAVYDNKLYYADTAVGVSTGEVLAERCGILRCGLQENVAEAETVLEITEITALGDAVIQEGVLYCSWLTTKDQIKHVSVDLATGKKTEFSVPELRKVLAVTAEGYYYEENGKIYSCHYESGEETLFCEVTGEVCAVYREGDSFCVLTEEGSKIIVEQFGKDGKPERCYSGLEKVGTDLTGKFAGFVKAEENALFYNLSGEADESGRNTFLIRMDLEKDEKEILGGWYTP